MNCLICKTNKIGPKSHPYGGFLCSEGHMQCHECNGKSTGRCGLCHNVTHFVQMTLNPEPESLAAAEARIARSAVGQAPTSPLPSYYGLLVAMERNKPPFVGPPTLLEKLETQSNISQEHMSMIQSKEARSEAEGVKHKANVKNVANDEPKSLKYPQELKEKILQINEELPCTGNEKTIKTSGIGSVHLSTAHNARLSISNPHQQLSKAILVGCVSKDDNFFIFQEDPEDHNILQTSNITCMGSSDSMKNLLLFGEKLEQSGDRPLNVSTEPRASATYSAEPRANLPYVMPTESGDHLVPLSEKVLGHFDNQNSSYRSHVVENYLKSYRPLVCYHFPNYNCTHQQCEFNCNSLETPQQQPTPRVTEMKSISVSTDSEPRLSPVQKDVTKSENNNNLTKQLKTQNYVVLHSTGVGRLQAGNTSCFDKFGRPSLELQMQKILQTFQENPNIKKIPENPDAMKGHFTKLPIPGVGVSSPISRINFQHKIPNFTLPMMSEKSGESAIRPQSAKRMNIPRVPLQCPDSKCERMIFISDFSRHLVVDHSNLLVERISSFQSKHFSLDPHLVHSGKNKCHILYLLRDKIFDLGNSEYKDYLPVLIMTSRLTLSNKCRRAQQKQSSEMPNIPVEEFLMIWVTGLLPEELSIAVSLELWPISDLMSSCRLMYSGDMYSIRKSQQALDVWHSGQMLLLSAAQVHQLTNGGKDMINVQLEVH